MLSLSVMHIYAGKTKRTSPDADSTATSVIPSFQDSLVNQCVHLMMWVDSVHPTLPHTSDYIRTLSENVDFSDSLSCLELQKVINITTSFQQLDSIRLAAQRIIAAAHLATDMQMTLEHVYNKSDIEHYKDTCSKLDMSYLTSKQKTYLEEQCKQIGLYNLATINFLQVIGDIYDAKDNASTFSDRIHEDVIDFEGRNENINRIPFMQKLYAELIGYMHQGKDGSFSIDQVQWDEIERLKVLIANSRKE